MSIGYPFVDGGNGGTLDGLIAAHARALALCNDRTRVIPGHGALAGKAELAGLPRDAGGGAPSDRRPGQVRAVPWSRFKAPTPTKEYDERWGKGFVKPEIFIQRIYIELSRARKKRLKAEPDRRNRQPGLRIGDLVLLICLYR